MHMNLFPNTTIAAQNNDQAMIRINSMEFPEDETYNFYVGSEDYKIYQANLHSANSKDPIEWRAFADHMAPVTKISLHPGKSMVDSRGSDQLHDMSELLLSASMDWTVKLWFPKNKTKNDPIHTFESSQEYVYDV